MEEIKETILNEAKHESKLRNDVLDLMESNTFSSSIERKHFEQMADYYLGRWAILYKIIKKFNWEDDYRNVETQ